MIFQVTADSAVITATEKEHITRKFEKAKQFYSNISRCEVVVNHQHELYKVSVNMQLDGKHITLTQESASLGEGIETAFDRLIRLIKDHKEMHQSQIKSNKIIG